MLVIIQTHPTQYHSPLYRFVYQKLGVPLTVIYASDFSVAGYEDKDFESRFAWKGLLDGYPHQFIETVVGGGARNSDQISAKRLRELVMRLQPAVLMLTGYSPSWHQKAFWLTRNICGKRIFRAEATDLNINKHNLLIQLIKNVYLRWFYSNFNRFLYIGKQARDHYLRLGVKENQLIFSPYCIDPTIIPPEKLANNDLRMELRKSIGLKSDSIVILFSGKFIQRKGGDLLIRAVRQLPPAERERVRIIFLGDGPCRKEWQELSEQQPQVYCSFTGFKNQDELSDYFLMSDLLVLPSRQETWGLVVNEALAYGLPCIVSERIGCASDLIEEGKTGWIFQHENISDLSRKISVAFNYVKDAAMRDHCLKKSQEYSLARAAQGIAQAYFELIK